MPHRVQTHEEGACKWLGTYKVLFTLSRSCRGRQCRKKGAVVSFSEARREPGNQDQTGLSLSLYEPSLQGKKGKITTWRPGAVGASGFRRCRRSHVLAMRRSNPSHQEFRQKLGFLGSPAQRLLPKFRLRNGFAQL